MRTPRILIKCFGLSLVIIAGRSNAQPVQNSFIAPSVGLSVIGEDIRQDRRYNARLFTFQQGFRLSDHQRKQWPLFLKMEAHFAINNIKTAGHRDFEVAGASGLELHYVFRNGCRLAPSITGGPAFISAENAKQRRGFLFTTNSALSLHIPVGRGKWFLKPEIRYRHMSNAGLWSPNIGLDNLFLMISLGTQHFARLHTTRDRSSVQPGFNSL